jgi:AcrR family transcriptional regulator
MATAAEKGQGRRTASHVGLKGESEHTQTVRRAQVARAPGAAHRSRVPLSRERIVAAALALVEERGLQGFTFRRLGEALGCEAMSVYHYFPDKRHLLDAMVEHALAGVREPAAQLLPVERLRFVGREYRAMAHRHPKLFPLVALHRLNMPAGVAFIERILRHFHAALPDDRLAAQAFRIFGYYLIGAALDETAGYAQGPSAAEPVADDFIARECPRLAAAAPYFKRPHFDSTFDLGFETMLKGIMALRAEPMASGRPPPKPVVRPKA